MVPDKQPTRRDIINREARLMEQAKWKIMPRCKNCFGMMSLEEYQANGRVCDPCAWSRLESR